MKPKDIQFLAGKLDKKDAIILMRNIAKQIVDDSFVIVQVTDLTKSLVLTDASTEQEMSNASAQTLTIEPDSTTNFPIGTRIIVFNYGVGIVSIATGVGVTINGASTTIVSNGQYSSIELVKRAANTWTAAGGII